jgi:transcription elongation GreA/GreB family factor
VLGKTSGFVDRPAAQPWCCLSPEDVRLIETAAAIHGGPNSPTGRAVTEKIRGSVLELRDSIPPGHVRLDCLVTFAVDGGPPMSRILVHWDEWQVPGSHLSLATPWGITLLGMRIGSEAAAYWRDGTAERLRVLSVEPAAARRADDARKRPMATAAGRSRRRREPISTRPRAGIEGGPTPPAA